MATPTPSGATSPVPLNHNYDAPSVDLPSLISNWDFETDAYNVGTVGDGGRAPNYDFETGDFTNWLSSGTASVKSGGPTGYYAELGSTGRITSTAFTVPSTAQAFTVDAYFANSSAALYVYVLSGPSYGTQTTVAYATGYATGWTKLSFDAAGWWRGQSIKLVVRRYLGTVGVDNVGVANVVAVNWDGAGIVKQVSGGPTGKYI